MGKADTKNGGPAADPRFAAMHKDPRFQRFPKQKHKVAVDKRFAGMFEDPDFQLRSAVDKRGRKVDSKRRNEDLRRYYRLRDEDEWRQEGPAGEGGEGEGAAAEGVDDQQQRAPPQAGAADGAAARTLKGKGSPEQPKQKQEQKQQNGLQGKKPQRGLAAAAAAQQGKQGGKGPEKGRKAAAVAAEKGRGQKQLGAAAGAGGNVKAKAGADLNEEPAEEDEDEAEDEEEQQASDDKEEEGEGADDAESESDEEEEDEEEEEAKARERWARARGMLGSDSSGEDALDAEAEYDSADEPLTDEEGPTPSDEQLDPEEWGAGANALNPDEQIPQQDETCRLALVDLDWDHVRAVDILAVLRSFLPRGSALERVTVYPSDFGLQRMAEEAAAGPKLILKPSQGAAGKKAAGERKGAGRADSDDDEAAEVDKKRLAAYEKSRLRYYYAIVECDCIATALHLYNECDGMEFERSACKFDMRFVPDEQIFEGRQIRDTAADVPTGYEPPSHFNISLQHTDPKLSWDAEDPERKRKLQGRRLKTDEELLEADFAAYLGSDDDDDEEEEDGDDEQEEEAAAAANGTGPGSEAGAAGGQAAAAAAGAGKAKGKGGREDAEALRQRYRALLLGEGAADAGAAKTKGRVGGKSWLDGDEEDGEDEEAVAEERRNGGGSGQPSTSAAAAGPGAGRRRGAGEAGGGLAAKGDVDMVVTFHGGLEGLGERLKKKKEEERARAGETVWEAYLRKKREKRAQRKAQGRLRNLSDSEDSDDYISDGEGDARQGGKGRGRDDPKTKAKGSSGEGKAAGRGGDDGGDDDDMYGDVASDDPFFRQDDEEDPFADPFFNQDGGGAAGNAGASGSDEDLDDGGAGKGRPGAGSKGKKDAKAGAKKGSSKAGTKADRADLELLLMDDAALRDAARGVKARVLPAGHDLDESADGKRKLTKKEKREMKKEAKRRARVGSDEEDAVVGGEEAAPGFAMNLQDPRFADMFRSADFALDPTDPRFKKMQAREKVLTEVQKRRTEQPQRRKPQERKQQDGANGTAQLASAGTGVELRAMVAKLKRKAEAQQAKQRAEALGKGFKKSRL